MVAIYEIWIYILDRNPPSPNTEAGRLRWRKDQTQWRQANDMVDR